MWAINFQFRIFIQHLARLENLHIHSQLYGTVSDLILAARIEGFACENKISV